MRTKKEIVVRITHKTDRRFGHGHYIPSDTNWGSTTPYISEAKCYESVEAALDDVARLDFLETVGMCREWRWEVVAITEKIIEHSSETPLMKLANRV